jgi:hypothetical protein
VRQEDHRTPGQTASDRVEEKEEVKKKGDRKLENSISM